MNKKITEVLSPIILDSDIKEKIEIAPNIYLDLFTKKDFTKYFGINIKRTKNKENNVQ